MKFSVPYNWQKDLIGRIDKRLVYDFYGKLREDFTGGGRSSFLLPQINKNRIAQHIVKIHEQGLKFNYLLNSSCLGNKELTMFGQRKLFNLFNWLVKIKVDSVTVSIPYLLELIKRNFPKLKVNISVIADVDSIERAKHWQDLGADLITLSCFGVSRDFVLLKQIRKHLKCELQLIANLDCLYDCPFHQYHSALNSHASQTDSEMGGFIIEYCSLSCRNIRMKDPSKYISAGWIRPEDVHHYEDIGIDKLKFVDRGMTTEALCRIVSAYSLRRHEGNLLDLFCSSSKRVVFKKFGFIPMFKYFFRPLFINIFRLYKEIKSLSEDKIYIDNRKLDGFIEHFLNKRCALNSCEDCNYCREIAAKAVTIDVKHRQNKIKEYSGFLEKLISGSIFKYF